MTIAVTAPITIHSKQKSEIMENTLIKFNERVTRVEMVQEGKFLSFFLGEEEYAIEILKVREIIGLMPITPIPKMPSYLRGVINLRGKIVPVMNLRLRFELPKVEDTHETCVVVVQQDQYLMGILVDKVSEVTHISVNQMEEVPSFGVAANSAYLTGIAKVKETVKMIVDVNRILFDSQQSIDQEIFK